MKQKSKLIALSAVVMSMSMSMSIFADNPVGWKQTNGTWQYVKDASGSVYSNGWRWIDGKCYYFDANGNMLSNTSTPDGYYVNGDGQWVYQNVVQTKEQYDKSNMVLAKSSPVAGCGSMQMEMAHGNAITSTQTTVTCT